MHVYTFTHMLGLSVCMHVYTFTYTELIHDGESQSQVTGALSELAGSECMYACIYIHIHVYTFTYIELIHDGEYLLIEIGATMAAEKSSFYVYVHIHTHIQAYTHMHTHTHTHTYIPDL
jgi:hypothetical protein